MLRRYRVGNPFMPRLYADQNTGFEDNIRCYGGLNITNPATLDPTTGILYGTAQSPPFGFYTIDPSTAAARSSTWGKSASKSGKSRWAWVSKSCMANL